MNQAKAKSDAYGPPKGATKSEDIKRKTIPKGKDSSNIKKSIVSPAAEHA
jgi:hypothetical protein